MEMMVIMLVAVLILFINDKSSPYDDTDAPKKRSGLKVKTDHLTGKQYLVTMFGGITPRIAADGTHMSAEKKSEHVYSR